MGRSEALPYLQKAELLSMLKTHEGENKINQKRGRSAGPAACP